MRRSPTECASAAARAWNHVLKSPESRARSGRAACACSALFFSRLPPILACRSATFEKQIQDVCWHRFSDSTGEPQIEKRTVRVFTTRSLPFRLPSKHILWHSRVIRPSLYLKWFLQKNNATSSMLRVPLLFVDMRPY